MPIVKKLFLGWQKREVGQQAEIASSLKIV